MNKFPKKLTALILLCALLVTALASCTIQPGYEGAPQGMRPCNEGENGAILYVPSYWNVNDSTGVPSAYYSDRDYSMITMITVPAEEVAGRSVPEYWESYKTSFTSSVSDFAITKSAETDPDYTTRLVADNACTLYRYDYSFKLPGLEGAESVYCFSQAFVVHPQTKDLFIITYSAPSSVYESHLEDLTKVYDNFRLVTETIPMQDKTPPAQFSPDENAPDGFSAITGEHIDYILYVPNSWTPLMNTGMTAASDGQNKTTTVNVTVFESNGINYDDFFSGYENDLKATFGNITFENPENKFSNTHLDGYAARKYVYTVTENSVEYKYRQTVLINGGYIYLLTFCCKSADFAGCDQVFSSIEQNFRFKNN